MGNRILDWLYDNQGYVIAGLAAFILLLGLLLALAGDAARKEFLDECAAYEPRYKCVAMWRGGSPKVLPVPVIVPAR